MESSILGLALIVLLLEGALIGILLFDFPRDWMFPSRWFSSAPENKWEFLSDLLFDLVLGAALVLAWTYCPASDVAKQQFFGIPFVLFGSLSLLIRHFYPKNGAN